MENNSAVYFLLILGSYFIGQGLYPLLKGEGFSINIPVFGSRFMTGASARVRGFLAVISGALGLTVPFYSVDNRSSLNMALVFVIIVLNVIIQNYKVKKYKNRPGFSA